MIPKAKSHLHSMMLASMLIGALVGALSSSVIYAQDTPEEPILIDDGGTGGGRRWRLFFVEVSHQINR